MCVCVCVPDTDETEILIQITLFFSLVVHAPTVGSLNIICETK